jgi:hypothetical protein
LFYGKLKKIDSFYNFGVLPLVCKQICYIELEFVAVVGEVRQPSVIQSQILNN